jgi:hypothetical protein
MSDLKHGLARRKEGYVALKQKHPDLDFDLYAAAFSAGYEARDELKPTGPALDKILAETSKLQQLSGALSIAAVEAGKYGRAFNSTQKLFDEAAQQLVDSSVAISKALIGE